MKDFEGKSVLIVGASSGIGKASAEALIRRGAKVYNASRTPSGVVGIVNLSLDVTLDFAQIEGLPDQLDGLVYCPGSINLKPFQSLKPGDFLTDFEINVLGAVRVVRACLRQLKASAPSGIVFFSTVAVSQGMGFHASIAASKGAVEGLSRSLAAELSRSKVRVNTIAPSLTDTPMASGLLSSEEKRKASEDRHPIKGIGSPEELAGAVVYLLSDASRWITGQVLHVDGGMSSVRPL